MDRDWKFEVDKLKPSEQWERPGKPDWSDRVVLIMSRRRAFDLIATLAHTLRSEQETVVVADLLGLLEPVTSRDTPKKPA